MTTNLLIARMRCLDLTFAPRETVRMQPHAGSAWRGAFGHALKRMVCAMRLRPCEGCPLASLCIYPAFFGNGEDSQSARPFILCPAPTPRDGLLRAGQPVAVRLTLLPGAEQAAPYVLRALLDAAQGGLTSRRVAFDCLAVTDAMADQAVFLDGPLPGPSDCEAPPAPSSIELRFVSPLRIRLSGDLLTGATLQARHLVAAALRRLRTLSIPISSELAALALREAAMLRFDQSRLGWVETTRFSTRQDNSMQLGGIVGEAIIDLREAPHAWPLLWAGTILHLGKGATMGFGRIEAHAS